MTEPAGLPTYAEVFANTLANLATKDERIVAITAAMPNGTGLDLFRPHFPKRYFDVGIAEEHAVVFAAGMVSVVVAEVALATVAPVQPENTCPAGAALALMVTEAPAA